MDPLGLELHLYNLLVPCDHGDSQKTVQIKVWRAYAEESARLGFLQQAALYNDKADRLEYLVPLPERVMAL